MNKPIKPFSFPERNSDYENHQIVYDKSKNLNPDYIDFCYKKNTSAEAISIANQFFAIEEILLESFLYVLPIYQNRSTCSVKFATVIRESCNLIEILFRNIYPKYFIYTDEKLNIYKFLILDKFLNFTTIELRSPTLESYHLNGELISPFQNLKNWDGTKGLSSTNIPDWWHSYNQIKHDVESIRTHATLHNAIYSLSALFILIRVIYGDGLICGFLRKYDWDKKQTTLFQVRKSDIFFGEILKSVLSK